MPLSEAQRHHFEQRLREERDRLRRDLGLAVADQAGADDQERAGDLSAFPFHIADRGTDTFDDEMETASADRLSRELEEIDAALDRLYRHPERFGICEDTGRPIPLERLEIVPWARTCVQAEA